DLSTAPRAPALQSAPKRAWASSKTRARGCWHGSRSCAPRSRRPRRSGPRSPRWPATGRPTRSPPWTCSSRSRTTAPTTPPERSAARHELGHVELVDAQAGLARGARTAAALDADLAARLLEVAPRPRTVLAVAGGDDGHPDLGPELLVDHGPEDDVRVRV